MYFSFRANYRCSFSFPGRPLPLVHRRGDGGGRVLWLWGLCGGAVVPPPRCRLDVCLFRVCPIVDMVHVMPRGSSHGSQGRVPVPSVSVSSEVVVLDPNGIVNRGVEWWKMGQAALECNPENPGVIRYHCKKVEHIARSCGTVTQGQWGEIISSINIKDISQENEHTRYSPLVYARDFAKKKEEIMRRTKDVVVLIRKRIDAAWDGQRKKTDLHRKMPRGSSRGSQGRVPIPSVLVSSEVVVLDPNGHHSITQAKVNKIQETLIQQDMNVKLEKNRFFKPTFDRIGYIEKTQEKQQAQISDILKNEAAQQDQLNEIQNSVELLVSLLLPDDAKKGEKVIKSKCKTDQPLKGKNDDNEDQGNSERGRGHGQGKGSSSRKAGTSTQRSSSDADRRKSSDKQVLTKPDVLI
ncbi:hypothetical protein AgCh_006161 [Apium graveolens]